MKIYWCHRHVFNPDECNIIVLDEIAIKLQRTVTRGEAEVVELDDCMWHAARALIVGEVVATLEEDVDSIEGGRDGEVVVVDKGDGVNEGMKSKLTIFSWEKFEWT